MSERGEPLLLRTDRHPCVSDLKTEGIVFARSFDDIYDAADTFEDVYSEIVEELVASSIQYGRVGYLVPGHPMFGEKTVGMLLKRDESIEIELFAGTSFVDACLIAARQEASALVYSKLSTPFVKSATQLIYQVYDRQVAGLVKLSLLELYDPEFEVQIISHAGRADRESARMIAVNRLDHVENHFDHLTTILVPPMKSRDAEGDFTGLVDIMSKLRHPTKGCPWDREQTPQTLKKYAIEEVYEVIDAIDEDDVDKYIEELGDLLLQVVFHAQLARESGEFSIEDVIKSISEKLLRRHPHVFGDVSVSNSDEVLKNWEVIKRGEEGNRNRLSRLDGIPRHLPALSQAMEVSRRAAKAGFEWDHINDVFEKVSEEICELREALVVGDKIEVSSELGDLIFTIVNVARFAKIDPEEALRVMVKRFSARFRKMENAAGREIEEMTQQELEALWVMAKREELNNN
jgi:tetrapyrrole methylase family protein/MazG family protein